MRHRPFQVLVLVLLAVIATSPSLAQGKRVALVIGNSEYKHTPRLENPKNDAGDMAATLKKLGFAVIEGRDLDGCSSTPDTGCRWADRTTWCRSMPN